MRAKLKTEVFPGLPCAWLQAVHCTKNKSTKCIPALKGLTVAGAMLPDPEVLLPP